MNDFIAIDVETANNQASSICAIGAVKVINGVVVDKRYSLIYPEPDWFAYYCVKVHGITIDDVYDAPSFGDLWQSWSDWFEGLPFVAHNAAFDGKCISSACKVYGIDPPDEPFRCTLAAARKRIPKASLPSKSLDSLCDFFGICLKQHHNALDDAEACAKLAMFLI